MSNLETVKQQFIDKMNLKDRYLWRSGYWTLAEDYEELLKKKGNSLGQEFWDKMTALLGEAKQ